MRQVEQFNFAHRTEFHYSSVYEAGMIRVFRWTLFSVLVGVLSGISSSLFLILLDWATRFRDSHSQLIWALPIIGFFIGWIFHHYGHDVSKGNNLIIDEIHDPQKVVPLKMAPFILGGTVLTHLFGGSAGREGTAVQMGASLADQLSKIFRIEPEERKILLVAGAGSSFGAAIGAPWAGVIFGMEVISIGRLQVFALFECLLASFVAFYITHFLNAPHSIFPPIEVHGYQGSTFFFVILAGLIFGLVARCFSALVHFIEQVEGKILRYAPLKPLIGGLILVFLYRLEGSFRYVGLGIPSIQEALQQLVPFSEPVLKAIFTALTVASGFKGGEFVPLVFIGATLGSAMSVFLPVSLSLLAALGFAAVFAGAANTPIACSIMAIEIFGLRIAPYAFVCCFMSYYFSGHQGIYKAQKVHRKKHYKMLSILSWFGELPRRFLNGSGE